MSAPETEIGGAEIIGRYKITRDKFISTSETKHLIKVCEEQAAIDLFKGKQTWVTRHVLVVLVLNTGLRVREIAALKIGDIYLGRKKAYIRVRDKEGVKKRDVYFDVRLGKLLKKYVKIKGEVWKQPSAPGDYLFSKREGRPFICMTLNTSFKKALEKAELPMHHSIHHARHTYATHLLAETGDLQYVQKQLGHESMAFTVIYADALLDQDKA